MNPLDFARWAGGELVIILPDGCNLLLTPDQVSRVLESGEYRLNAAPAHGRGRPRKEEAF
ncbi:MAG: hypothetical protein ACYC59_03945 [Anaerolineaceae bacterium]